MKLIVALGNIGKEYENTRHNVGFMVADSMFSNFQLEKKFIADCYQGIINDEKFIVIKPRTFMNNSGDSVIQVVNYYHIKIEDILVIQDDMDLPLGTFKLKRNSSAGGHNGIKSIIEVLHSDKFLRLKVGIGRSTFMDTISYVLGKFSKEEIKILKENFSKYQEIIETFIKSNGDETFKIK